MPLDPPRQPLLLALADQTLLVADDLRSLTKLLDVADGFKALMLFADEGAARFSKDLEACGQGNGWSCPTCGILCCEYGRARGAPDVPSVMSAKPSRAMALVATAVAAGFLPASRGRLTRPVRPSRHVSGTPRPFVSGGLYLRAVSTLTTLRKRE
jgi:hypothetical protein